MSYNCRFKTSIVPFTIPTRASPSIVITGEKRLRLPTMHECYSPDRGFLLGKNITPYASDVARVRTHVANFCIEVTERRQRLSHATRQPNEHRRRDWAESPWSGTDWLRQSRFANNLADWSSKQKEYPFSPSLMFASIEKNVQTKSYPIFGQFYLVLSH